MTVTLLNGVVHLDGDGSVALAEPLLALLQTEPVPAFDLTRAGSLHTAILQLLLAFRPPVVGPAGDAFVETWLMPLLRRGGSRP